MGLQLEEEEEDILSRQVRNFLLVTKEKRSNFFVGFFFLSIYLSGGRTI